MIKRLALASALIAVVALPGIASAGAPTGRCPAGFETWNTADIPGYGTFYGYQSADLNGDGLTCVRLLPNSPAELAFMDNVMP